MSELTAGLIVMAGVGLIVYGAMQRTKRRRADPFNDNRLLAEVETPDPAARQEGNIAIGLGVVLVLGALFSL